MASVRPYQDKDKERVQRICLMNAECMNSPVDTQKYILIMYCNYYIAQEPENCFVAVNDDDEAVGYIICSEDYDKYEKIFLGINYFVNIYFSSFFNLFLIRTSIGRRKDYN